MHLCQFGQTLAIECRQAFFRRVIRPLWSWKIDQGRKRLYFLTHQVKDSAVCTQLKQPVARINNKHQQVGRQVMSCFFTCDVITLWHISAYLEIWKSQHLIVNKKLERTHYLCEDELENSVPRDHLTMHNSMLNIRASLEDWNNVLIAPACMCTFYIVRYLM